MTSRGHGFNSRSDHYLECIPGSISEQTRVHRLSKRCKWPTGLPLTVRNFNLVMFHLKILVSGYYFTSTVAGGVHKHRPVALDKR